MRGVVYMQTVLDVSNCKAALPIQPIQPIQSIQSNHGVIWRCAHDDHAMRSRQCLVFWWGYNFVWNIDANQKMVQRGKCALFLWWKTTKWWEHGSFHCVFWFFKEMQNNGNNGNNGNSCDGDTFIAIFHANHAHVIQRCIKGCDADNNIWSVLHSASVFETPMHRI